MFVINCCPNENVQETWLTKIGFGQPNAEIGQKMANGQLLFLSLAYVCVCACVCVRACVCGGGGGGGGGGRKCRVINLAVLLHLSKNSMSNIV